MRYTNLYNQPIPQSQPLDKRQVKNNAGGFVYQITNWERLERFLILGSDANTYYQKAPALTRENAQCVIACWDENPVSTAHKIAQVSSEGRAPKNDPAIFALALGAAHKDPKVRQAALSALPGVCRTATHLFQFVKAVRGLGRGWGRGLKRAVADWYNKKPVDAVAYQVIKYRDREGWTHKDLMRVCHPDGGKDPVRRNLYKWIRGQALLTADMPDIILPYLTVNEEGCPKKERLALIKRHNLPWEALPTECNTDPDYWEAQLPTMGLTALVRNLGSMSRIGLIKPLSAAEKLVTERLQDEKDLHKSRIHPFNILLALKTYESGHGFRGQNTWPVSQPVVAALDKAFYKAFKNVEPTNKRWLFGLDVSGSMGSTMMNTNLRCCEATAALALVTANTEPQTHIMGFGDTFRDLGISPNDTLVQATKKAQQYNFGGTDCSLPMTYALGHEIPVDVFVVITDNETWAGRIHPPAALQDYRNKMRINSKLIVVGLTSTSFSIADPDDPGMLDVVGFDSAVPAVMADFARK